MNIAKLYNRHRKLLSNGLKLFNKSPIVFLKRVYRMVFPIRNDYRKCFNMTLRQWLIYHQKNIVFNKCHWMGVCALKNPLDAWIYQEIIYNIKPDIIIEIGSDEGGSTLYLAHLLDIIGKGEIISVDISREKFKVRHDRIILVTGDSSSAEVFGKISKICENKKVLVIHDGDHSKKQVSKDMELYSSLVSVGSYLIIEDSIVDLFHPWDGLGGFGEGPLVAINEFLKSNANFIIDRDCERYIITYNPRGFLKRIS